MKKVILFLTVTLITIIGCDQPKKSEDNTNKKDEISVEGKSWDDRMIKDVLNSISLMFSDAEDNMSDDQLFTFKVILDGRSEENREYIQRMTGSYLLFYLSINNDMIITLDSLVSFGNPLVLAPSQRTNKYIKDIEGQFPEALIEQVHEVLNSKKNEYIEISRNILSMTEGDQIKDVNGFTLFLENGKCEILRRHQILFNDELPEFDCSIEEFFQVLPSDTLNDSGKQVYVKDFGWKIFIPDGFTDVRFSEPDDRPAFTREMGSTFGEQAFPQTKTIFVFKLVILIKLNQSFNYLIHQKTEIILNLVKK